MSLETMPLLIGFLALAAMPGIASWVLFNSYCKDEGCKRKSIFIAGVILAAIALLILIDCIFIIHTGNPRIIPGVLMPRK